MIAVTSLLQCSVYLLPESLQNRRKAEQVRETALNPTGTATKQVKAIAVQKSQCMGFLSIQKSKSGRCTWMSFLSLPSVEFYTYLTACRTDTLRLQVTGRVPLPILSQFEDQRVLM